MKKRFLLSVSNFRLHSKSSKLDLYILVSKNCMDIDGSGKQNHRAFI